MPENPGAPENGTSTDAGAPASSGQGFDYERGYQELRPEFTRATQRLSEYETLFAALHDPDPAVQAEAAEFLGLDLVAETGASASGPSTDDDDWDDPLEKEVQALRSQVEELRNRSELEANARQEAETVQLRDEFIGDSISFIEESLSVEGKPFQFSEQEEEVLGNLAIAMADEDDVPDVQGAYQRLYGDQGVIEHRLQQRYESKRGALAAPLGSTIPADQKPKTRDERIRYMDERWQALSDQQ